MLLDTDILIDVALDRRPHSDAATELLDRLQRGPKRAFVAWHTLSNLYYLVAPRRTRLPGAAAPAHACGARHIITRNLADFRRSPIPAIAPRDALDTLF